MAFTEQNKADAYLFFVLAFNAAPGTVYGGQIVEAYEAGLTTADIVAQYVEKPAFTSLYPTTQTASEFATALVNNVSSSGTTAAVKASAVADIETALAAGWTKAQVVTQILGNLANKTVADTAWGQTVAQLNNKIAVAKALTEGPLALTSEDAAVLQGPLSTVTFDQATVQPAINGAGPASNKIEALVAANKAKADFLTAGKFADSAAVLAKVGPAVTAVEGANGVADTAFSTLDADNKETVSAATQAAIIAAAKQKNAEALTTAKAALTKAKTDVVTTDITKVEVDSYLNTKAAKAAAAEADTKATTAQADAVTALDAVGGANGITATAVAASGTVTATVDGAATTPIITVQAGKLALTAAFIAKADAKEQAAATKLLDSIVAAQVAAADKVVADDAAAAAETALGVADLATVKAAVDGPAANLKTAEDKITSLEKTLKDYNEALANLVKDQALTAAVAAAEKAFTDAGQNVPVTIGAAPISTAGANLFVLDGKEAATKTLTGFAADDKIYAGKDYTVSADITKGDDAKLEVFFKANGANTDVYIEQKAFGSSTVGAADGNANFVKITLTGVAADKLVLKDGFVTVAA